MADHPTEEHLNDPEKAQPENTAGEIAAPGNIQPVIQNQEPENMEVHHHPDLHHKPKPWKEYLLEGLMIFIAVMLGFIAENIREGITNREHVKVLVSQLVQDLQSDTSQLNVSYRGETDILEADSALTDLLGRPLKEVDAEHLQQLIVSSHSFWPFYPSGGAIGAIKNEIHLKQFSNSKMIGLIAEYEARIDLLHTVEGITLQYQRMYIDPFLVQHFTAASLHASFNGIPGVPAEVRNLSGEDLARLGSEMALIRINTKELIDKNRKVFAQASDLLEYAKKEFNPPVNEGK